MTVEVKTFAYDVNAAYLAPLIKDTATEMAYGAMIKMDGVQSVKFTPTYTEKELKGDGRVIDNMAKLASVEVSAEQAQLNLKQVAAMFGHTLDSISGLMEIFAEDMPFPFGLWFMTKYTEVQKGFMHTRLFNMKATKWETTDATDEYMKVNFTAKGTGTKNFVKVVNGEKVHPVGDKIILPGPTAIEIPDVWPAYGAWPPTP